MNLSSLATNALATTRSTFKGLAEAAVSTSAEAAVSTSANGGNADAPEPTAPVAGKTSGQADSTPTKPVGVRLGTLLDAYA